MDLLFFWSTYNNNFSPEKTFYHKTRKWKASLQYDTSYGAKKRHTLMNFVRAHHGHYSFYVDFLLSNLTLLLAINSTRVKLLMDIGCFTSRICPFNIWAVFRIRFILIRIRILGSVSNDYGSGTGSKVILTLWILFSLFNVLQLFFHMNYIYYIIRNVTKYRLLGESVERPTNHSLFFV